MMMEADQLAYLATILVQHAQEVIVTSAQLVPHLELLQLQVLVLARQDITKII